ncbi:aldo/keto reductase [Humibacter sp.]|jgi:aryl-alcohol dehydrogenase-like predicted oxidoreductase|uniref:aldo/keto reductase n=1 Tax=Humibacter sp. TaxID=1940291 RepID=UPI002B5230F3|nr:aldo/keto reductase [Humibacter sp.]HVX06349.1 aldo/keto reductase [Humibacter sp.]
MAQPYPVRAREHAGRGASGVGPVFDARIAPADYDGVATAPLPIVAPRRLGETELAVYPLGLGTAALARADDIEHAQAVLDRYLHLGGNLIVTSDAHALGLGNAIVGGWMHRRDSRDEVVLDLRVGRGDESPGLGQVNLVRSVESALRRLGTDRVDIVTLEGPDPDTALSDTLATVEWLIDSGKARFVAFSGFAAESLMEARVLSSFGLPKVAAIEVPYSLMNRATFEGDLRIVSSAQSLGVLPVTPLAHGFLAGAYRSRSNLDAAARLAGVGGYLGRRGHRVLQVLDRIAAEHGCSMVTIAVAWLLAKRGVVAPIVNVASAVEVDDLMSACSVSLSRTDMLELDRISE